MPGEYYIWLELFKSSRRMNISEIYPLVVEILGISSFFYIFHYSIFQHVKIWPKASHKIKKEKENTLYVQGSWHDKFSKESSQSSMQCYH